MWIYLHRNAEENEVYYIKNVCVNMHTLLNQTNTKCRTNHDSLEEK